jgi:hypothetical protein
MSEFLATYVLRVLFAPPSSAHRGNTTARRWHRLAPLLFEPYRPELHYMRGPGPKWREKHERSAGQPQHN